MRPPGGAPGWSWTRRSRCPRCRCRSPPVQLVDEPRVVHLFSFSKTGLAAERLGVIAAHPRIIAALRAELRANAIAASHLGQLLAAALLEEAARRGPCSRLGHLYRGRWQTLRGALGPVLGGGTGIAVAR